MLRLRTTRLLAAVCAAALGVAAHLTPAQALTDEEGKFYGLCSPAGPTMQVHVKRYPAFVEEAGLTRARIRRLLESRLRYHRIHDARAEVPQFLQVFFIPGLLEGERFRSFAMELAYQRPLMLPTARGNWWGSYTVWTRMVAGSGDTEVVIEALEVLLDSFLDDFLPVQQAETCQQFRARSREKPTPAP